MKVKLIKDSGFAKKGSILDVSEYQASVLVAQGVVEDPNIIPSAVQEAEVVSEQVGKSKKVKGE